MVEKNNALYNYYFKTNCMWTYPKKITTSNCMSDMS